jgi:hypothetical protein
MDPERFGRERHFADLLCATGLGGECRRLLEQLGSVAGGDSELEAGK